MQKFYSGSTGTIGKENGMAENDLAKKNARTNATKGWVCIGHLNRERGTVIFSGVLNSD